MTLSYNDENLENKGSNEKREGVPTTHSKTQSHKKKPNKNISPSKQTNPPLPSTKKNKSTDPSDDMTAWW